MAPLSCVSDSPLLSAPYFDDPGLTVWPSEPTERRRLLVLLLLAALLRITYLLEYLSLPFIDGPLFDSVVYLRQAESIEAGRLGDPSLVAFSPLYGYFLAAFGADARLLPIAAQLFFGLCTLYLLHRAAAALFDEVTALSAGLLLTGYGLVVFYETKLMSEALGLFLLVASVTVLASASFRRGRLVASAGAGSLLALAVLARASLLFCVPFFVVAAFLPWAPDEPRRARARRGLGLGLSIALIFGAHGLENLAHTGLFVPVILPSQTAAEASRADWTGSFDVFGPDASPWDVVDQARERIARAERGEPDPPGPEIDLAGLIRRAPVKAALTFRDTETSFDYGYYGERSEVRVFALMPLSFGAIALLALAGAVLLARTRGWRALVLHLPIVMGVLAVAIMFHPSSRYRLPLVVPLVLLGGYAARQAVAREGPRRWLGAALLFVVIGAFAVPTYAGWRLSRPAAWHVRVAEAAIEAGRYEEADLRLRRALSLVDDDDVALRHRLERLGASSEGEGSRYLEAP